MAKRNKNIANNKKYFIPLVYFLALFDLFLIYGIKYYSQKLSLLEFRFFNLGNFIVFLIALLIIIGVTVIFIKNDVKDAKRKKSLLIFPCVVTAFLLIALIVSKIPMSFGGAYFLQQPLHKFIVAMMYFLYEIVQVMYLVYIWMMIMGRTEYLFLKSLVDSVIIFVGIIAFAFFFSIAGMHGKNNVTGIPEPADVAVVFGSAVWSDNKPSPSLSKRVEKAVDLYKAGVVQKIQLTGGNAPGELAEAEVGYNLVKKYQVDMKNVMIEKKTASTIEQVQYIKKELVEKAQMQKIIVISDHFHLNRINEICNFHNIKPQLVSSELYFSWEKNIFYEIRESIGLIFFWLFAI